MSPDKERDAALARKSRWIEIVVRFASTRQQALERERERERERKRDCVRAVSACIAL